jgi:hypothetical protein
MDRPTAIAFQAFMQIGNCSQQKKQRAKINNLIVACAVNALT